MVRVGAKIKAKLDQAELHKLEGMFEQREFPELDRRLKHHIRKNPGAFFLYNILGVSQLRQNKFSDAINSLRKVIDCKPDHAEALSNTGLAYLNLGQYEKALEYFQKAKSLNPKIQGIDKNLGAAYNNIDRFTEAVASYSKALEQNSNDAELHRNIAIAYDNLKEYPKAHSHYQKSLELNPNDAEACSKYGYSLIKSDNNEMAVKVILEGQKICGDSYDMFAILGAAYNNLGDYSAAIEQFEKAIEKDQKKIQAYTNICATLINQERYEEALVYYDQALEIFPGNASIYYFKGSVYNKLERFEAARDSYLKSIEFDPKSANAHFYLGVCYINLGHPEEAISSCERAIAIKNDFVNAYINLGIAYRMSGDGFKAAQIFQLALSHDETSEVALRHFAETVRTLSEIKMSPMLRKHLIMVLKSPKVASISINPVINMLLLKDLDWHINQDCLKFDEITGVNNFTHSLLSDYLKYSIVTDSKIENFAAMLRSQILSLYANEDKEALAHDEIFILLQGLALQGFRNEYVWYISDEEYEEVEKLQNSMVDRIESGDTVSSVEIFLLASFVPLAENTLISQWCEKQYGVVDEPLKGLIRTQLVEPSTERDIRGDLVAVTSIEDEVSTSVQNQYEENPYPRWDSMTEYVSEPYINRIRFEVEPNKVKLKSNTNEPEVLIAGCGTGKHPISCALQYRDAKILAVDLSRASLSYGARKAKEMGVENITFSQADILKLGELDRSFDIIECCGVLHHMKEPEAGLKVLLSLLKPGGYMKIALYSEIARHAVADLREKIAGQSIDTSRKGLQRFRHDLQSQESEIYKNTSVYNDIYSASAFRDLLLHVQEHRFTVLQLQEMMNKYSLKFLGFCTVNPQTKAKYQNEFPDDTDCTSLENWHIFEEANPQSFSGMYNFWCCVNESEISE
ncbi:MAG: tetratricopeptide repeat protein [Methyloligellaceae bacterium]